MSKTVDERIVSMQFDNRHFEKNVQTSLGTLDKLKNSLNLTGASKGLENVEAAAKGVNMSPLSSAVEKVGLKFSAMQVMAIAALSRITNSAITAGKNIVSALTIDPIKTGFQEYETQINAIQTILANTKSKGTTLDDVNGALDELNTYADKTIYNFTEMTRNIGTFTAAGVDLDTSVSAIKGIANLAAVSGSTSQQASTAMYQLSQAMSSGTVRLMDWNSVVNAGMGGQVFQDALKETARVHGIAIDDIIKKQGSFRESLSEGWLTTEILTETLSKFTGDLSKEQLKSMGYTEEQIKGIMEMGQTANDAATKVKTFTQLFDTLKEAAQSGWTQTWEIIVGDFEEAKDLLTKISDVIGGVIGDSAEARNELLENWKVLGGRDDLIESFKNVYEAIVSIIKPIKEAFDDIFPPLTAEKLAAFTAGLKELTSKFKLNHVTSDNLKRTFKGLFAIIDIGNQLFVSVVKVLGSLSDVFGDITGGVLGASASFGDWLTSLSETIRHTGIFDKVLQGIVEVIKAVFKGMSSFAKFLKTKIVSPGLEVLGVLLKDIAEKFSGVGSVAIAMKDGVVKVFDAMSASLEQGALFKILTGLWTIISKIASAGVKVLGGLFSKFSEFGFDGLLDFVKTLVAGGVGVGLVKFINSLKSVVDDVGGFMDHIKGILNGVKDCLAAYQDQIKATALLQIAKAVALLAASILVLSLIDPEKLGSAISALALLFTEILVAMSVVSKIDGDAKGLLIISAVLISIASAMLILSVALKLLSTMSWEEMGVGLISIATGLAAMVAAVNLLPESKVNKAASAIKKLSSAMLTLSVAIKILSTMSWKEMGVGLISMTVGLAAMVAAVNLLPSNKVGASAFAITMLASAMLTLSVAIKILSTMSWKEMGVGLIAMVAGLTAVVAAVNLLPKNTGLKTLGMIGLAMSILILAGALKVFASLSWEGFAKGMAAIGGSIVILAVGLNAMKGTFGGAAALLAATLALNALAPILVILGGMRWSSIAKGLITIAGAFIIIGVAGAALAKITPAILKLALAIALIGVAVLAAGVGLMAFGAGLTSIAAGLVTLFAAITSIAGGIVKLVEDVVVGILRGLGNGIVALCEIISNGAPAIGEALVVLIVTVCEILVKCIPVIADTVLQVMVGLLDALVSYTPRLVDGIFDFIIALIDGVADRTPDLIQSLVNIVMSIFSGTIDALKNVDPDVLIKGIMSVGLMAGVMAALAAVSGLVPAAMAGVIGMGIVVAELALVLAALGKLSEIPGLMDLVEGGGNLLGAVGHAIGSFVGGLLGGIAEGITSVLPQIGQDLADFATNSQPFFDLLPSVTPESLAGVQSLGNIILQLTATNILDGLTSWLTGGSSLTKFGEELAAFAPNFKIYADTISGINPAVVTASATAAKALAEMANTIPNSGGVVSWFAGDNSVSKFGGDLIALGMGLSGFATATAGINPETTQAAANSAKSLAEMTNSIPNSGGMASWFTGESSVSKFAGELTSLGKGLKSFSTETSGINPENITAAANSAKALAEMTQHVPKEGGIKQWFTGESSIATFANKLPALGKGLKGFSDSVAGINPDKLSVAADAAKAIADMTGNTIGNVKDIPKLAENLGKLATGVKNYFTTISGITSESITASENALESVKKIKNVDVANATNVAKSIKDVASAIKELAKAPKDAASGLSKTLSELGKSSAQSFVKPFKDAKSDMESAAQQTMQAYITGLKSKGSSAENACEAIVKSCATAIKGSKTTFYNAGSDLVSGFASGISENDYKAVAKARAMAKAAAKAAEEALDINSPSKVFRSIGYSVPEGFAMGIDKLSGMVKDSSVSMTDVSVNTVSDSISRIADIVSSDIDAQPTIRPVLDLSDVEKGANSIGGLFGNKTSVGVMANVGAISKSMRNHGQNGETAHLASEIDKLSNSVKNMEHATYIIDGITFTEGSDIEDAFKTIIRHAKMERRV